MRRDFRIFYEQAEVQRKGFTKFIKKFPSESEPKFHVVPVFLKKMHAIIRRNSNLSKKSAMTERFISMQNVELAQSTSRQRVSEDEGDADNAAAGGGGDKDDGGISDDEYNDLVDLLSEDESESFDLPPSLLIELRRDCIKKSGMLVF